MHVFYYMFIWHVPQPFALLYIVWNACKQEDFWNKESWHCSGNWIFHKSVFKIWYFNKFWNEWASVKPLEITIGVEFECLLVPRFGFSKMAAACRHTLHWCRDAVTYMIHRLLCIHCNTGASICRYYRVKLPGVHSTSYSDHQSFQYLPTGISSQLLINHGSSTRWKSTPSVLRYNCNTLSED